MTQLGDALLARVLKGSDDGVAHELLGEFFAGYPVDNLRRLLHSNNDRDVRIGAWIASELGARAEPLVDDLAALLGYPTRYVRFFVLDSILAASSRQHGKAIARAILAIHDPDDAVRWKAMNFLANASEGQLAAGLRHLGGGPEAALTSSLLASDRASDVGSVTGLLDHGDHLSQMFAAATAARLAPRDPSALQYAAHAGDDEIRTFAKERLQALTRSG